MMKCDYVIVGAGIIGLSLAYKLSQAQPEASICLLEKEEGLGFHSSGRNSGVLHSGIYYPEKSLKARFCADGARQMKQFCSDEKVSCKAIGKVIIPKCESDIDYLGTLYHRAQTNGAKVELIKGADLTKIEPEANAQFDAALYSPTTSVVNPQEVLDKLQEILLERGVKIFYKHDVDFVDPDTSFLQCKNRTKLAYEFMFNTSGFSVDKIAQPFALADEYQMLPFRGSYYKLSQKSHLEFNGLIYPVPDLNVPFLGIHSVKDVEGNIYFGPSAVPAFGRLNYKGLEGVDIWETCQAFKTLLQQYLSGEQGFRKYAHNEALQFFKGEFTKAAKVLVPNLESKHLKKCNKVGIRTQLFNKREGRLEMDFVIKIKENTIHVLNTVSPGFTSSFAVADYLIASLPETFKN